MVNPTALILTEVTISPLQLNDHGAERFVAVSSSRFSAILQGETASHSARSDDECQIKLTFDPKEIAVFLTHLETLLLSKSELFQQIRQAQQALQPNDSELQSQFTLQLVDRLTSHTPHSSKSLESLPSPNGDALHAQLQQTHRLEQQILDRTQDLRDTLVTAQAASRAKTEFLSTVSHELRTPLTIIIGLAATLLRCHLTQSDDRGALTLQKQQEYLQTIQSRGEHLLALINDILDLSQAETGKAVLDIREFSLFQLAQQALESLQEKAELKKVKLRLDLSAGAEFLRSVEQDGGEKGLHRDRFQADPQRVTQILINLLSNAIKFTPEYGCVTLRVWVNEERAILRVEDTGIGIPEAEISLLFQKFQQLDASYHRKYEGTGLGLALTKQLVELHNGTIEVESKVGVGSHFTVHLPSQAIAVLFEL
ncbi:sensor histidine kinase [Phormidesmis priestleyi ULC007]|uniref:histidine kinase n=1 Tax=Phormidesmis priestleyi ULC007 TaxID=1920490 RepID=A0A2T1D519_9CYAN|nr:HAMP domain-containing sensor histidine kinase [Phormidesmis priestleyi]PSB15524.1 sensor histidine kinase [Phormidesmis priestleyi ULC007]PZO46377.1 MAG: sensor histidine kinase [Phormidesmis priestleyi]